MSDETGGYLRATWYGWHEGQMVPCPAPQAGRDMEAIRQRERLLAVMQARDWQAAVTRRASRWVVSR